MEQKITYSPTLAEVYVGYKTKVKSSEMPKITKSEEVFDYLLSAWDEDSLEHREECLILLLNRSNRVLGWSKVSSGGVAGTVIDPKLVFQIALKSNASAIILAHNHPSGNLEPSTQDKELTKRIKDGGKILDITLLDHVIVTAENYYSFADEGQL